MSAETNDAAGGGLRDMLLARVNAIGSTMQAKDAFLLECDGNFDTTTQNPSRSRRSDSKSSLFDCRIDCMIVCNSENGSVTTPAQAMNTRIMALAAAALV